MAKITLNNKENAKDLICFNTTPHIITVENEGGTEVKAKNKISVASLRVTDDTKQGEITVNGYTITSTSDMAKVGGRKFFCDTTTSNSNFKALSIVNALNNIPQLAMNYDIMYDEGSIFTITAKKGGAQYNITTTTTNISGFQTNSNTNGSTTDSMCGTYFSKVYLDLYVNDNDNQRQINNTTTEANYEHLVTLQKEYYKDSVSFNVSPALHTMTDYGKTIVWKGKLYAMVDKNIINLGTISDNYMVRGYLVNQGGTYIDADVYGNQTIPAINVDRGTNRTQYNNSVIYVYEPTFHISLYKNQQTTENVKISYLESDETEIMSTTQQITLSNKNLDTYVISLDETYLRDSFYVDLQFSFGIIRLNVINPPHSQVENNRVYWYNSYGGVSHFDFVGNKDEERKTNLQTYKKSLLDFYKVDKQEQEIVYFRENNITVSLTTHLIEKDGLYQLYDLQNSYKAWVTVNGVDYYIIVESIAVEEPSDNVYTVTIKYKYSLLDSFA